MVSVNLNPALGFHLFQSHEDGSSRSQYYRNTIPPITMAITAPSAVTPASKTNSVQIVLEDPNTKGRKPYTIIKSIESWTEKEHDKFLEALQLYAAMHKYFLKVQKNGTTEHAYSAPGSPVTNVPSSSWSYNATPVIVPQSTTEDQSTVKKAIGKTVLFWQPYSILLCDEKPVNQILPEFGDDRRLLSSHDPDFEKANSGSPLSNSPSNKSDTVILFA